MSYKLNSAEKALRGALIEYRSPPYAPLNGDLPDTIDELDAYSRPFAAWVLARYRGLFENDEHGSFDRWCYAAVFEAWTKARRGKKRLLDELSTEPPAKQSKLAVAPATGKEQLNARISKLLDVYCLDPTHTLPTIGSDRKEFTANFTYFIKSKCPGLRRDLNEYHGRRRWETVAQVVNEAK